MFVGAAGDRLPRRIEVDETWLLASGDERARSDEAVDMVSGEAEDGAWQAQSSECQPLPKRARSGGTWDAGEGWQRKARPPLWKRIRVRLILNY